MSHTCGRCDGDDDDRKRAVTAAFGQHINRNALRRTGHGNANGGCAPPESGRRLGTVRLPFYSRKLAYQCLHAAGSGGSVWPVMSRSAWNTHVARLGDPARSSAKSSSLGTAVSRCFSLSIPDCARLQAARSRIIARGVVVKDVEQRRDRLVGSEVRQSFDRPVPDVHVLVVNRAQEDLRDALGFDAAIPKEPDPRARSREGPARRSARSAPGGPRSLGFFEFLAAMSTLGPPRGRADRRS